MKITFLGLSCFLIENKQGHKILIDPYDDSPKWNLGLNFPKTINGKRLCSELVLFSHMDADHCSFRPEISIEPAGKKDHKKLEYSKGFPNLNLHGLLVQEWNGFPNIAWAYTIDGFQLLHLADNVHVLSKSQIKEAGKIDVLFISPSKILGDNKSTMKNIEKINPKFVVWAHHIPALPYQETDSKKLFEYFKKIIPPEKPNKKRDTHTINVFTSFLLNIFEMNKHFKNVIYIDKPTYLLGNKQSSKNPTILFFRTTAKQ